MTTRKCVIVVNFIQKTALHVPQEMFKIIGLIEIFISDKVRLRAVSLWLKNLLGRTLGNEASRQVGNHEHRGRLKKSRSFEQICPLG